MGLAFEKYTERQLIEMREALGEAGTANLDHLEFFRRDVSGKKKAIEQKIVDLKKEKPRPKADIKEQEDQLKRLEKVESFFGLRAGALPYQAIAKIVDEMLERHPETDDNRMMRSYLKE